MTEHYTVADFSFAVTLLEERDLDMLLPSFRSFRSKAPAEGEKLFELVEHASLPAREADVLLDEDSNDMGHTLLYRTAGSSCVRNCSGRRRRGLLRGGRLCRKPSP